MDNIKKNLGFIIFIILSISYLIFSYNLNYNIEKSISNFIGFYIWFSIIYLILKFKNVENRINYSSIIPIIFILVQFFKVYDKYEENKIIKSFKEGVVEIRQKWGNTSSEEEVKLLQKEYIDYFNNNLNKIKIYSETYRKLIKVKDLEIQRFSLENEFMKILKDIENIDDYEIDNQLIIMDNFITSIKENLEFYKINKKLYSESKFTGFEYNKVIKNFKNFLHVFFGDPRSVI